MKRLGFTRAFYDPLTATAISTAFQVGGRLFSGFTEAADDDDRALFAEDQAVEEAVLRRQELDDFDKEQRARESRQNAIFAAQGADLTSGNPLAIAQSRAAETAEGRRRIERQSRNRQTGFERRAEGFRRRSRSRRTGALLTAASGTARGGQQFLRIANTRARTNATGGFEF